jgi:hypothetical protein
MFSGFRQEHYRVSRQCEVLLDKILGKECSPRSYSSMTVTSVSRESEGGRTHRTFQRQPDIREIQECSARVHIVGKLS